MKKLILSTLMMAAATSTVFAQDAAKTNNGGAFVRVGVGYGFAKGGSNMMTGTTFGTSAPFVNPYFFNGTITEGTSAAGTTYAYDIKNGSLSAGFGATIAGGYMFNRHVGIELGVNLGVAMKKYELVYTSPASMGDYTETTTTYAKMPVLILPSLVFATGNTALEGYARAGLAIPVAGKTIIENELIETSTNNKANSIFEIKNKISLGLQGAVGARYHVSDMLAIYLELTGMAMSMTPKTGEFTEFTVNGANELTLLETMDREYEFNNEFTTNPGAASSTPYQEVPVSTPFSNIGIGFGVNLNF